MYKKKQIHFIGIAGIGMSSIAQILTKKYEVTGSDRFFDNKKKLALKQNLINTGIKIFKQDGSAINKDTYKVVYSTSICPNSTMITKAKLLNISLVHRSDILYEIIQTYNIRIAVSGTSGKTSVCGIIYEILKRSKFNIDIINGGNLNFLKNSKFTPNLSISNKEDQNAIVFEADESDRSLIKYNPTILVINNIQRDHGEIEELKSIFTKAINNTTETIIYNYDCIATKDLINSYKNKKNLEFINYSFFNKEANFRIKLISNSNGIQKVLVNSNIIDIPLIGLFNIYNIIPSYILSHKFKIDFQIYKEKLKLLQGIENRVEYKRTIFNNNNKTNIYYDYAHNPHKIANIINTFNNINSNAKIFIFRPHGFTPMQFYSNDLINAFTNNIKKNNIILIMDIYRASEDIIETTNSLSIVNKINKNSKFKNCFLTRSYQDIIKFIKSQKVLQSDTISDIIFMTANYSGIENIYLDINL